jgi:hypothetical protein
MNMAYKILAIVITIIALILGVIVSFWHQEGLGYIIFISRFFDVMLPILAVGALLKYLFTDICCTKKKEEK